MFPKSFDVCEFSASNTIVLDSQALDTSLSGYIYMQYSIDQ